MMKWRNWRKLRQRRRIEEGNGAMNEGKNGRINQRRDEVNGAWEDREEEIKRKYETRGRGDGQGD
jgi:hypothetical protein